MQYWSRYEHIYWYQNDTFLNVLHKHVYSFSKGRETLIILKVFWEQATMQELEIFLCDWCTLVKH